MRLNINSNPIRVLLCLTTIQFCPSSATCRKVRRSTASELKCAAHSVRSACNAPIKHLQHPHYGGQPSHSQRRIHKRIKSYTFDFSKRFLIACMRTHAEHRQFVFQHFLCTQPVPLPALLLTFSMRRMQELVFRWRSFESSVGQLERERTVFWEKKVGLRRARVAALSSAAADCDVCVSTVLNGGRK